MKNASGAPESRERKTGGATPFPFARMEHKRDALDRLDLQFRWGRYGIRVLRCHLASFGPGQIIAPHKHSEYEFHFIPRGRGSLLVGEDEFRLEDGLFYLTGPGVVHEQRSDEADPMHELCLHCEIVPLGDEAGPDWGDPLEAAEAEACVKLLETMPAEPAFDRYHAMTCFLDAYRAWEEQPLGFYSTMKQTIVQILLRAARVYAAPGNGSGGGIPERDMKDHRFRLAAQFIEDNESRPITLEEVAERVQVSPRQLQRIFRSEGGTSFTDWVEHVRLQHIREELVGTDKAIEEIALGHGFANPNYVYPVFKRKFGTTPAAYRRQHAGGHARPAESTRATP